MGCLGSLKVLTSVCNLSFHRIGEEAQVTKIVLFIFLLVGLGCIEVGFILGVINKNTIIVAVMTQST